MTTLRLYWLIVLCALLFLAMLSRVLLRATFPELPVVPDVQAELMSEGGHGRELAEMMRVRGIRTIYTTELSRFFNTPIPYTGLDFKDPAAPTRQYELPWRVRYAVRYDESRAGSLTVEADVDKEKFSPRDVALEVWETASAAIKAYDEAKAKQASWGATSQPEAKQ